MCIGFHVKYRLLLLDFNETLVVAIIFEKKFSNITFLENQSNGNRVIPFGRTDMTKMIVVFRNFANALKNESVNVV